MNSRGKGAGNTLLGPGMLPSAQTARKILYVDISFAEATNASAAKSNVMVKLLATDVAGSASSVFTQRTPARTTPASKSAKAQDQEYSTDIWKLTSSGRNFEQLFEQMKSMQDQIGSLSAALRSVTHSDQSSIAGSRPSMVGAATGAFGAVPGSRPLRRVSTAREAPFQGPTTSAFSFDLARSSLQQRGIVERHDVGEEGDLTQEPSPMASPSAPKRELGARQAVDPLWALPKNEALRLCHVYEEEMGIMYPVLELPELVEQVELLYGLMNGPVHPEPLVDERNSLDHDDVYILRLVFACALTAEASGRSEQAIELFDSVREVQDNCVWGSPDIKSIIFLTLVVRHFCVSLHRFSPPLPQLST